MAQTEVCKMGYDFPFGQSRSLAVSGGGSAVSYISLAVILLLCYGDVMVTAVKSREVVHHCFTCCRLCRYHRHGPTATGFLLGMWL